VGSGNGSDDQAADALLESGRWRQAQRDGIWLLALTAQRRAEVAGMAWEDLDLAAGEWRQPGMKNKSRAAHVVPLATIALKIIKRAHEAAGRPLAGLVLRGVRNNGRMDANFSDLQQVLRLETGIAFRLHDFRRAAVSAMAERGVDFAVADAILNHAASQSRAGMIAVYQHAELKSSKRRAMEIWEAALFPVGDTSLRCERKAPATTFVCAQCRRAPAETCPTCEQVRRRLANPSGEESLSPSGVRTPDSRDKRRRVRVGGGGAGDPDDEPLKIIFPEVARPGFAAKTVVTDIRVDPKGVLGVAVAKKHAELIGKGRARRRRPPDVAFDEALLAELAAKGVPFGVTKACRLTAVEVAKRLGKTISEESAKTRVVDLLRRSRGKYRSGRINTPGLERKYVKDR
jgi:hypothetical protein